MRGAGSGVLVKPRSKILHMPLSSVPWITVDLGPPLSVRLTRQAGILAD